MLKLKPQTEWIAALSAIIYDAIRKKHFKSATDFRKAIEKFHGSEHHSREYKGSGLFMMLYNDASQIIQQGQPDTYDTKYGKFHSLEDCNLYAKGIIYELLTNFLCFELKLDKNELPNILNSVEEYDTYTKKTRIRYIVEYTIEITYKEPLTCETYVCYYPALNGDIIIGELYIDWSEKRNNLISGVKLIQHFTKPELNIEFCMAYSDIVNLNNKEFGVSLVLKEVRKFEATNNQNTAKIKKNEKQIRNGGRSTMINVSVSVESSKRSFLVGMFNTLRNDLKDDKNKIPMSGVFCCQRIEKEKIKNYVIELKSYITSHGDNFKLGFEENENIKNFYAIKYFLDRKRMAIYGDGLLRKVEKVNDLPNYTEWEAIHLICGYYKVNYVRFTDNTVYETGIIKINIDGTALFFRETKAYNGFVKKIENNLLVYFDYLPTIELYRLMLTLYKPSDKKDLLGVLAGKTNHGINVIGVRVYLEYLENCNNLAEAKKYLDTTAIDNIEIDSFTSTQKNFFSGTDTYRNVTDGYIWADKFKNNLIPELASKKLIFDDRTKVFEEFNGFFSCYSFHKIFKDNDTDEFGIEKSIIHILPDGTVEYTDGRGISAGQAQYNATNNTIYISLNLKNTTYASILFETGGVSTWAEHFKQIYGIIIKKENHIEARVAVLVREDKDFKPKEFIIGDNKSIKKDRIFDNEVLEIDKKYSIVSYLMGEYNRYIRIPRTPYSPSKPRDTKHQFHFYAACSLAELAGNKKLIRNTDRKTKFEKFAIELLIQSYYHGFASNFYAGYPIFSEELKERDNNDDAKNRLNEMKTTQREILKQVYKEKYFTFLRPIADTLWEWLKEDKI